VSSSFATLINKCQGSKLHGQGPSVKMLRGPMPHGSYSPVKSQKLMVGMYNQNGYHWQGTIQW